MARANEAERLRARLAALEMEEKISEKTEEALRAAYNAGARATRRPSLGPVNERAMEFDEEVQRKIPCIEYKHDL